MLASLCIVLLLLLLAAASALLIDNKQKRLDRRVVTAAGMLDSHAASQASIRRQQVASRWKHLHRLVSYKPGMAYEFRAEYVVFAGIVLALAIMYVNIYLGLHFDYRFVFLVAIGVGTYVVRLLFKWQHRQLADKLFRQLPDTIQIVTSTVKAGSLVIDAFTNIAKEMPNPTAGQFVIVCNEIGLGKSAEEAIEGVYQRTGVAEYAMFAVTLAVQMKAGGNLSETLETLGETVRERVALAARAKAIAAEVIFSARALSVAPILIGGLMYWINPEIIDMLFYDPTGHILLTYAVTSVTIGILVIRGMIRRNTAL